METAKADKVRMLLIDPEWFSTVELRMFVLELLKQLPPRV